MSHARPLTPALVTLDDPPTDPDAAIDFLLDLVADAGRLQDRESARRDIETRQQEGGFGMGLGIALPHARTDAVTEPTIAFARSDTGVDFDTPDDEAATLLVLILVPSDADADHLDLLSRLSRGLVDEDVRTRLRTADEPGVVSTLTEVVA